MRSQSIWKIWSRPLLFGTAIVFGLLSALLGGGGFWWAACWMALAAPLAAIAWFAIKARRS